MSWKLCPFCKEGYKGVVPIMCTEDEFLYLNYLAKKHETQIDSIFIQLVRDHIEKKFPEWKPYHPLESRDFRLAEVDGELKLVEEHKK